MSGVSLFQQAETAHLQGNHNRTFELYQKAIKKILRDENPTAPIPAIVPEEFPQETLGAVWRNFVGYFRDPALGYTEATSPEAYKLLSSFKPSNTKEYPRFRGTRGQTLLKAMQITSGLTLGLLAWDKQDRATAAKRYQEALDLAATHEPFNSIRPDIKHLERWVAMDVKETRDNLAILTQNDKRNAEFFEALGYEGGDLRKSTVHVPSTRIEGDGSFNVVDKVVVATDACKKCGERKAKLMRCGKCKMVNYCGAECQKADWKSHKLSCAPPANS